MLLLASLMSKKKLKMTKITTQFTLEGRFRGFRYKDGWKIRSLYLTNDSGDYIIKLSKSARLSLRNGLALGDGIRVTGDRTLDPEKATISFKATTVHPINSEQLLVDAPEVSLEQQVDTPPSPCAMADLPKATIRICQKSTCWKRGGKAVFKALQQTLQAQEGGDRITIKPTGCMKLCKAGPNLVMPDKTRHTKVAASDIPDLVHRHCPGLVPSTDAG
jgi:(2Fe-2S) ferredoxin